MTKPDFAKMTIAELRAYVLQHREDNVAFYALADRVRQDGVEVHSSEQLVDIIAARQNLHKKSAD